MTSATGRHLDGSAILERREYSDAGQFALVALYMALGSYGVVEGIVTLPTVALTARSFIGAHHTRTAILMAAIFLEARASEVWRGQFGKRATERAETLSAHNKLAIAHEIRAGGALPGHITETLKAFASWRNEFAHGRLPSTPAGLPRRKGMSLSAAFTPLSTPKEEIAETLYLLRGFVTVLRFIDSWAGVGRLHGGETSYELWDEGLAFLAEMQFDGDGMPAIPSPFANAAPRE